VERIKNTVLAYGIKINVPIIVLDLDRDKCVVGGGKNSKYCPGLLKINAWKELKILSWLRDKCPDYCPG
jgi:hypothetical protein